VNQLGTSKALKNNISMGLAGLTFYMMIRGFPNPVLPIITVKPRFEDIMNTQKLLSANCISIPSLASGRPHGHLGLIMTVQECASISSTHFDVAVYPGPIAQICWNRSC
jgi:hypothetical protein